MKTHRMLGASIFTLGVASMLLLVMAMMAPTASAATQAPEVTTEEVVNLPAQQGGNATISHVCLDQSDGQAKILINWTQAPAGLVNETGIVTVTNQNGGVFVFTVNFAGYFGNSARFTGGLVVTKTGDYTVTSAVVGLPTYFKVVHNTPFGFNIPNGGGAPGACVPTVVRDVRLTATTVSASEDHIQLWVLIVGISGTVLMTVTGIWIYRGSRKYPVK